MLAVVINPLIGAAADRTRRHRAILTGLIVAASLTALVAALSGEVKARSQPRSRLH